MLSRSQRALSAIQWRCLVTPARKLSTVGSLIVVLHYHFLFALKRHFGGKPIVWFAGQNQQSSGHHGDGNPNTQTSKSAQSFTPDRAGGGRHVTSRSMVVREHLY